MRTESKLVEPPAEAVQVVDLMAALEASLAAVADAKDQERRRERRDNLQGWLYFLVGSAAIVAFLWLTYLPEVQLVLMVFLLGFIALLAVRVFWEWPLFTSTWVAALVAYTVVKHLVALTDGELSAGALAALVGVPLLWHLFGGRHRPWSTET